MRIALVQMPPCPRDVPPFEMALTAAVLRREGHDVSVFDLSNELFEEAFKERVHWKYPLTKRSADSSAAICGALEDELTAHAEAILASAPDAVVFKAEHGFDSAVRMTRRLKAMRPGMPVVSSGMNTPDKRILAAWNADPEGGQLPFDRHILGEDDVALPETLSALGRGSAGPKLVVGTEVEDLDSLPFHDFTDYDFTRYSEPGMIRFCVSRGCPRRCAFCRDWVVGGKYRSMSGDRWFEEYRAQYSRHPQLVHFRHYDRLLNGDVQALDRFCGRVLEGFSKPPVVWGGDFVIRPEMTDGLIAKMARSGCNNLGAGLESGSERVRASMGKGFFSNELASRVFKSCRKHGILVSVNIMVGLPGEGPEDLEETLAFLEADKESVWEVRLTMPTVQLQPGTPLWEEPNRFGLKPADGEMWESLDGKNVYAERVRRFERLCSRALEMGVQRLMVNRRLVRTRAAVGALARECRRDD